MQIEHFLIQLQSIYIYKMDNSGISYRLAEAKDYSTLVDFYFDIFLKGKLSDFYLKSDLIVIKKYFMMIDEPAIKSRGGYLTRPLGVVDLIYGIVAQNISYIAEDTMRHKIVGISTHLVYKRY